MTRAKTIVSAGVAVYLNGSPYGRVREFSFESQTPKKVQYGIDATEPFELIPTTTVATGRMTVYRTVGDGGAEGAAITTQFEAIPKEKYFTLQLVEIVSDTIIFEGRFCSCVRQNWTIPERGIVTGVVEWESLDWSNEVRSRI